MPSIMPFGEKSDAFIRRSPAEDAKLNLLEGAVRSSKTFAVNVKLVAMVLDCYKDWKWPGGIGLISAVSKTTARTNMLNDIFTMLQGRYKYNQTTGELILGGKPFVVCGAKDEGSWKFIRGATVGVWIADEMTVYPRSFFDMALSRLSLQGSRMYGTTNPGNPYHYLKSDYLDRDDLRFVQKRCCHAESGSRQLYVENSEGLVIGQTVVGEGIDGRSSIVQILGADYVEISHPTIGAVEGAKIRFGQLWSEHFTLEDNPNIEEATKESFRRMYRGVFHRWYILGEWCVADGAIYRDVLTEDIYYDDTTRSRGLLSQVVTAIAGYRLTLGP
jgi:PBSX family phage terminase large subunit